MGVVTLITSIEKDDKRISILMNTNILKSGKQIKESSQRYFRISSKNRLWSRS